MDHGKYARCLCLKSMFLLDTFISHSAAAAKQTTSERFRMGNGVLSKVKRILSIKKKNVGYDAGSMETHEYRVKKLRNFYFSK